MRFITDCILYMLFVDKDCTVDAGMVNGRMVPAPLVGDEYRDGDLVSFHCDDGFLMVGSLNSVCEMGLWSDPFPQCVGKLSTTKNKTNHNFELFCSMLHPFILFLTCFKSNTRNGIKRVAVVVVVFSL